MSKFQILRENLSNYNSWNWQTKKFRLRAQISHIAKRNKNSWKHNGIFVSPIASWRQHQRISVIEIIPNKKIIRWVFNYFLYKFNKYTNLNHSFVLCTEWNRLICLFKILLEFFPIFSFVFTEWNRLIRIFQNFNLISVP